MSAKVMGLHPRITDRNQPCFSAFVDHPDPSRPRLRQAPVAYAHPAVQPVIRFGNRAVVIRDAEAAHPTADVLGEFAEPAFSAWTHATTLALPRWSNTKPDAR